MRALAFLLVAACGSTPSTPFDVGEIELAITSPAKGAELVGTEPTLEVTGTVATTTESTILEVWINGTRAEVVDGQFAIDVAVEPGINHIAVEASDGFAVATRALDVLVAGEYVAPAVGTANFEVPDAIQLRLGQLFFDVRRFGSDLDVSTDPIVASDLASALELVLHHVQLEKLLPARIQFGEGDAMLDVAIGDVTPQRIVVDARIIDTPAKALELSIDLLGVNLPMDGEFRFGARTMIVAGGITADLHATAVLTMAVAEDGTIAVEATDVTASLGPLAPGFIGDDGDELNALVTLAESDFRAVVEGLITEQLIPTFTDRIPPLVETILGAVDQVFADTTFMLDSGLGGGPVTVQLDGHIGALEVVPGPAIGAQPGHVTVREHLSIVAEGSPVHPASLGVPRIDLAAMPTANHARGVGLEIRLDFVNALLHSLWNRGLLEGAAMPGGFAATVSAKLPPVVRATPASSSCRIDDLPCDITLQLGQLEVQLADFGQTFAVNATAGARIVVDGTAVSIKIEAVPTVTVWEIANDGQGRLSNEAVSDIIKNVVWPELAGPLGDNLSFSLPPLPDLSTLGLDDIAPGLVDAELELVVDPRAKVEAGHAGLGASFRLVTPPLP
ncbi:MAG: hypothetical protein WKG01_00185 [Kofleriaceae bacterium]